MYYRQPFFQLFFKTWCFFSLFGIFSFFFNALGGGICLKKGGGVVRGQCFIEGFDIFCRKKNT